MTRVLHVHSGNLYGGVETLLRTLASGRELCPAMETHFALCFEGRLKDELEAVGAPAHMLVGARVSRPVSVWRARRALGEVLGHTPFDVVVCHSAWSQVVFGPAVRAAGLPLVFWMHAPAEGRHWLERWARRRTPDLVVCNSRFTASTLDALYPRARAEVLYCPVAPHDASHTTPEEGVRVREELETHAEATVIIQVSRMEEWKGHALHLEALGLLRDVPGWRCWMVGGGQRPEEVRYAEELKETAARLGIAERVRFAGERADVARLLSAADIFCQPNTNPEPFGITFVEAMLARRPVVTTAHGGAREIVDETCGLLVEPGDAPALASALRVLIERREHARELGAGGHERARLLCDPTTQTARLAELFSSVTRRRAVA